MKRGKEEEEKISVEPMFPRLNVKDDKGGGPRAPPRNKMALYEHLSIPSHTFTTHHNASFPRHTNSFFPPPPRPFNQVGTLHFSNSLVLFHVFSVFCFVD